MAITESEAKTKWCPFVRLGETGATYNRTGPAANLECIGSDCMAWRAAGKSPKRWNVINDGVAEAWSWDPRTSKTGYANVRVVSEEGDEPVGCCGLAGRP